ncbi:tRNA pseudouridine(13) synthase TruD [Marinobacter sp. X15-166B]|uniref:tRNA pseudouridine(13) synthase TruD n=1 Tax=Marinobacter sp. X15-166B TaxID=1897620 RepID=UPI00085CB436|nr:tRNA pseudouridine(13) synthase TruD [Marinobacter sp. X15-166B]OEY67814.1 pseudouridine synthase [Marinobacter sp. X15-166B]
MTGTTAAGQPREWCLNWPSSQGSRLGRALLKATPDTFFVDEDLGLPGFPALGSASAGGVTGQGEHLCLRLQKQGDNTDYVARELAGLAGCQHQDVGYCGMKDRHAVTRQWFSLYLPGNEANDARLLASIANNWPVLAAHRHPRKLRRGDHRGNFFRIALQQVSGDVEAIDAALRRIAITGCPNYYGHQRFGRAGYNLDRAIHMNPNRGKGRNRRQSGRNQQGLYFSAARSWLFNQVLAARVAAGTWQQPLPGEGEAGYPTGPLWGDGGTLATGTAEQFERDVAGAWPEVLRVFSATRMKPERRALVLHPVDLSWRWEGDDLLELQFGLAPGQYATALIEDVFELI